MTKEEALEHLGQGQLFLLTILELPYYVFALKDSTPDELRRWMSYEDLGDVPSPSDPYYAAIPNATVTTIHSLDEVPVEHRKWLPYLFSPFEDYVNWIDPTVTECIELSKAS